MAKSHVIFGLLGTKLDRAPARGDRWATWRPTVSICQHEELLVNRFELLYEHRSDELLKAVKGDMESVSPETKVVPHKIQLRDPWDFEEVYATLHQLTRDYAFDTDNEEYLAHITTGTHVAQICLFLLTESRHLPGSLLQTSPPQALKQKNASGAKGSFRIIDLDLSRYDAIASRFEQEHQEGLSFLKSGIETKDEQFNQLIERIEQVTLATNAPILLSGPTGAGKTLLARRIYQLKRQRELVTGELVEVNCATIRGEQSMSTLFGHTKGAFTGAITSRAGLLKAAEGGVLFLDEIGELGADEQAMLLHAIEEKSFLPLGSDKPISSDFQLIAGTNRDLNQEVAAGKFREDLLARINLWSFRLPGLAERRADIEPNIEFELQKFTEAHGRKVAMNKEARRNFLSFALAQDSSWNANFRDLNAAITRMATLARGGRITTDLVSEEAARLHSAWHRHAPDHATETLRTVLSLERINELDQFDRVQLAEIIHVCRNSASLSAAGRELFQVSRKAKAKPNDADRLRKYLAKFGLRWQDTVGVKK